MKKLLIILSCSLLLISCDEFKEKRYCGVIIKSFITEHKIETDYHVVFYCEELKKNILVDVTADTYVNTDIGESVCFSLSKRDIEK